MIELWFIGAGVFFKQITRNFSITRQYCIKLKLKKTLKRVEGSEKFKYMHWN